MPKYTFSRAINNNRGETEVFEAAEFASFDEAISAVEKGVYDRRLALQKEVKPRDTSNQVQGLGKKDE